MYRLVTILLADGLIGLSSEYGRQLWCLAGVKKRVSCCECGVKFASGTKMYRPIHNAPNRGQRMCQDCACRLPQLSADAPCALRPGKESK